MFRGAFAVNESLWCAWRACLQDILLKRSSCACHAPSRSLSACTAERRMHALAAAKQAELDAVCCLCLCVTVCADLLMCVFVCRSHKVFGSMDKVFTSILRSIEPILQVEPKVCERRLNVLASPPERFSVLQCIGRYHAGVQSIRVTVFWFGRLGVAKRFVFLLAQKLRVLSFLHSLTSGPHMAYECFFVTVQCYPRMHAASAILSSLASEPKYPLSNNDAMSVYE